MGGAVNKKSVLTVQDVVFWKNSKDGDSVLTFSTVMNMLILMCQKNNYAIYDNFFLDLVDTTTLKKMLKQNDKKLT